MIYVYGVDPATELNYCGISVLAVDFTKAHLQSIKKTTKTTYPEIHEKLKNMFQRMTPTKIVIDYTNNENFAQEIEAKLNPRYLAVGTPYYKKFTFVEPYRFDQGSKLALMQNMRSFFENKWFQLPIHHPQMMPETWSLIVELKEQLNRINAVPTHGEVGLKFPKPYGHDDDLAISLALALWGCKDYMAGTGGTEQVSVFEAMEYDGYGNMISNGSSYGDRLEQIIKNASNVGTERKIKVYKAGEDWW
jgi:hypothetical protein